MKHAPSEGSTSTLGNGRLSNDVLVVPSAHLHRFQRRIGMYKRTWLRRQMQQSLMKPSRKKFLVTSADFDFFLGLAVQKGVPRTARTGVAVH